MNTIVWENYYKKHTDRKPRAQLVRAVSFCDNKENALDLGAGTLIETKFLLEKGFKNIIAIDSSPDAKKYAKNLDKNIHFKNISFGEFDFPKNTFDLVNAQFALPFHGKNNFKTFIEKIRKSLKPKGIFVGQFFGINDSWNGEKEGMVFHTKQQALDLLSDMKILEFSEEEKDGKTSLDKKKHWHIFYFIAQKS